MNLRTGIDVIEVKRIEESINKYGKKFLNRVFTEQEIQYCESKKTQKFQSYAGRFAAKEAVFKALSECIDNKFDIQWKDIEVLNGKNGRPYVVLQGKFSEIKSNIIDIDISISHIADTAIASIVVQLGTSN